MLILPSHEHRMPFHLFVYSSISFFLFYFIFKLYKIVLVLPNIKMNPPQVYICSPSWTLLPPPSPYHPSGSSQCTSPKQPVSFIEPGLATRFIHDIIHVSMPFSQIFPPAPSVQVFYLLGYIYSQTHFIIFVETANRVVVLISLSAKALLAYRNATNF